MKIVLTPTVRYRHRSSCCHQRRRTVSNQPPIPNPIHTVQFNEKEVRPGKPQNSNQDKVTGYRYVRVAREGGEALISQYLRTNDDEGAEKVI